MLVNVARYQLLLAEKRAGQSDAEERREAAREKAREADAAKKAAAQEAGAD